MEDCAEREYGLLPFFHTIEHEPYRSTMSSWSVSQMPIANIRSRTARPLRSGDGTSSSRFEWGSPGLTVLACIDVTLRGPPHRYVTQRARQVAGSTDATW